MATISVNDDECVHDNATWISTMVIMILTIMVVIDDKDGSNKSDKSDNLKGQNTTCFYYNHHQSLGL